MVLHMIALVSTLYFSAVCLYVSLVEQPARMACNAKAALKQWRPSYRRAATLQIALALTSILTSLMVYAADKSVPVLISAAFIIIVIPFTLLVIMPTNKKLLDASQDSDDSTLKLLEHWGRLHNIRTALIVVAAIFQVIYFINF